MLRKLSWGKTHARREPTPLSVLYISKRQMFNCNVVYRWKLHETPLSGIEETIM